MYQSSPLDPWCLNEKGMSLFCFGLARSKQLPYLATNE